LNLFFLSFASFRSRRRAENSFFQIFIIFRLLNSAESEKFDFFFKSLYVSVGVGVCGSAAAFVCICKQIEKVPLAKIVCGMKMMANYEPRGNCSQACWMPLMMMMMMAVVVVLASVVDHISFCSTAKTN